MPSVLIPSHKLEIISDADFNAQMKRVEAALSECRHTGCFEAADGLSLFYEYYLAKDARANVVILHGFTEFSAKYRELSWYFLNAGLNVFVLDQRGHGHTRRVVSDPELTHVTSFDKYADDFGTFLDLVVAPVTGSLPVYIFSHSMGGSVAALYLQKHSARIERAVMSSPMICPITRGMPRMILRRIVERDARRYGWEAPFRFSHRFSPDASFRAASDTSEPRFRYNLEKRIADDMYKNSLPSNSWMYCALTLPNVIPDSAKNHEVRTRLLILAAGKDRVVRVGMLRRYARSFGSCRVIRFRHTKHTIYTSHSRILKAYMSTILEFFGADTTTV